MKKKKTVHIPQKKRKGKEEEEEAREGEREDFPSESLPQVPVTIYILF